MDLDIERGLLGRYILIFNYYYNVEIMADFTNELVRKDRFPIFFITYFAFYLNDCIIESFGVNSFNFENCCCCYCYDFSRFIALDINNYYYNDYFFLLLLRILSLAFIRLYCKIKLV